MEQPSHEQIEPPPPLPDTERFETKGRRLVWKRIMIIVALFYVVLLALLAVPLARYATVATHSSAVISLHTASSKIRLELIDGATMEAAIDSARQNGLVGPDARWALRVNKDPEAWLGGELDTGPGTSPVVLIVDRVFDDCFRAPGGEGRRGYYGIAATLEMHFIPEGELPDWARP